MTKPTSARELRDIAETMEAGPAKDAVLAAAAKQQSKETAGVAATKRVFKGPKHRYDRDPATFVEVPVGARIFTDYRANIRDSRESDGAIPAWVRVTSAEVIAVGPKLDKLAVARNYGGGNPDYREYVNGELTFAAAYKSIVEGARRDVAATELKLRAQKALLHQVIAMESAALAASPETFDVSFHYNPDTDETTLVTGPDYVAKTFRALAVPSAK